MNRLPVQEMCLFSFMSVVTSVKPFHEETPEEGASLQLLRQ